KGRIEQLVATPRIDRSGFHVLLAEGGSERPALLGYPLAVRQCGTGEDRAAPFRHAKLDDLVPDRHPVRGEHADDQRVRKLRTSRGGLLVPRYDGQLYRFRTELLFRRHARFLARDEQESERYEEHRGPRHPEYVRHGSVLIEM